MEKKEWRDEIEKALSGQSVFLKEGMTKLEVIEWIVETELDKAREEVGFNNDEISRIALLINNAEVGDIADAQLDMQILNKLSKLKE